MNELAAQRTRIDRIINAAQCIQDRILCGICLELYKEPVTIKCGHRFCRSCILRVTSNENSACPFCNNKIRKRSIPTEGNKIIELVIDRFLTLIKAIKEDSGIDVLEPRNKVKNTKESVPLNDKPSTSKFEQTSNISKGSSSHTNQTNQKSSNSKVKSQTSRRNSLTKKQVNKNSNHTKNTLHKYLSSNSGNVPDQELHSEDKVKNWLNNITSHVDDVGTSDSNNEDGSPFLKKGNENFKVPEDITGDTVKCVNKTLKIAKVTEDNESSEIDHQSSTDKVVESELGDDTSTTGEDLKYKETQSRIQELEMIAKRKKSNLNLSDKVLLKPTSSIPAATHSDAYDWRRVKKIGKEMQAKTFKSLNVSVEKSSSSVVIDDNLPSTSSAIHDNKSRGKLLNLQDDSHQREIPKAINNSMDTTGSHKGENVSLSCMDEEQVNAIIGISSAPDDFIPERTKNISSVLNKDCSSKLEQSSPLIKPSNKSDENDADNLQNSPSIHKLSLKRNLINSDNSKLISSLPGTPDRQTGRNQAENSSPRKFSPERPKSRLSLRLPPVKPNDQCGQQLSNAASNHSDIQNPITHYNHFKKSTDNDRNSTSFHGSRISFKKLGKICKKRKNVPFIQLGKIKPKILSKADSQEGSSVLVKSNVPVNFEIKSLLVKNNNNSKSSKACSETPKESTTDSKEMKILLPEEDSQLKYLTIESPHRQKGVSKKIDTTENTHKSAFETTYTDEPQALMEVDSIPPIYPGGVPLMEVDEVSLACVEKQSDITKENNFTVNEKNHVKSKDTEHPNKENVKDNFQSVVTKSGSSKHHAKMEIPAQTYVFKSSSSSDSESNEDDKEYNYSKCNNSSLVKAVNENDREEEDVLSIGLKESDKFSKNPSAQSIVQNNVVDLTEDGKNEHSESESDEGSVIQRKPAKKGVTSSSTISSIKEKIKYSEVESNTDSDESDAEILSKSKKTSSNSTRILNSINERNKVSEAESNADSDVPKIRRKSRKASCSSSSTLSSAKERNKASESEKSISNVNKSVIQISIRDSNKRYKSKQASSSSASTVSSIKKISKKKRALSNSSNDDEDLDVTSIIGKWCNDPSVQVSKKAKIVSSAGSNLIINPDKTKLIQTENDDDDDGDVTLVDDENRMQSNMLQRDPPIDDIISKVKSFKEVETTTSKLTTIPSSLMSADLFESNEPCVQPSAQISPKQVNSSEVIGDKSQDVIDTTLVDFIQNNRKKSNLSESSDGSNKENTESNKINPSSAKVAEVSGDRINENENSQATKAKNLNGSHADVYHMSESLMNITQEQIALKRIEKELMGVDLSTLHDNKNNKVQDSERHCTPQQTKNQTRDVDEVHENEDFDSENIGATPCAKKSRKSIKDALPNQLLSKFNEGSQINSSEIFSPGKDMMNLIPAITPVKNRTSYPLCHSTPVVNTSNTESQPKIVLVCSGLQADHMKKVHLFVKRFNAKFQSAFSMDVTHVVTSTNADTKVGQRTFKYIQGIAFQKHVLNFQWIVDCLDKNTLLDEEDEKYEVLDGDVFESGSKKSRNRQQGLFENFAFYCLEPFTALSIAEFKNILTYNGAVVVNSVEQLADKRNKYRVIILPEDYNLDERSLRYFKKAQCALVTFDWIVDSISQYHTISLAPYLQETDLGELLELGFPVEYLEEEECGEEEEEDDE